MVVKCINDKDVMDYVTKGKIYDAEIDEAEGFFKIDVCDDGGIVFLSMDRFEVV